MSVSTEHYKENHIQMLKQETEAYTRTIKQMILRASVSYAILESCKCIVITMITFFINVLLQQGQVQREHFPCAYPFLSLYLPLSYSL